MAIRFENDEPVELDCGCIAGPGDIYYEITIPEIDSDGNIKRHHVTYCGDDEYCLSEAIKDYLDIKQLYVETSQDKEEAYGDILYDRWKDDGF